MDKEALWWFIDLLILVLIFYFVFEYMGEVGEQTTFQKKYLSKDIALLVDTLHSVPGDININYPQPLLWFSIRFSKNKVEVFEPGEAQKENSFFIGSKKIKLDHGTFIPPEKYAKKESFTEKYLPVIAFFRKSEKFNKNQTLNLSFVKDADKIDILNNEPIDGLHKLNCPTGNLKDFNLIFLDDSEDFFSYAGHYLSLIGEVKKEEEIVSSQDNVVLALTFKPNTFDYVKTYFDADSKKHLSPISCSLTGSLSSYIKGDSNSIPHNRVLINKKSSTDKIANLLMIEIGKSKKFTDVDYNQIERQIYNAFMRIDR